MTISIPLLLLLLPGSIPSAPANPEDGAAWVELARKQAAANDAGAAVAAWRRAAELGGVSKLRRWRPAREIAEGRSLLSTGLSRPGIETLAARLDEWTGATFVGEPTGSRPNHFGNEAQFVLPHSGVRGTISSGWNQPVTARDARIWIAPAIRVRSESSDYFSGRDAVLDRIVSEIGAEATHPQ